MDNIRASFNAHLTLFLDEGNTTQVTVPVNVTVGVTSTRLHQDSELLTQAILHASHEAVYKGLRALQRLEFFREEEKNERP